MKIFLIVLLCVVVWIVSAISSALIIRRIYNDYGDFYSFVCTFFAPATFIVVVIMLPFYFLYRFVKSIVE